MPVQVTIDSDARVIFLKGEGVVTDDELLSYVLEHLTQADLREYDELVDLSEADLHDLTYSGLSSLAAMAASTDPEAEPTKIAILISEAHGMGISRLYQSLRESKGGRRQSRIFWDREECLEWLGIA